MTTINLDNQMSPTAHREIYNFGDPEVLVSWEFKEENPSANANAIIRVLGGGTLKVVVPKELAGYLTPIFEDEVDDVKTIKVGARGKAAFQFKATYGPRMGGGRIVYHVTLPEYCFVGETSELVYSDTALQTVVVTREKRQSITWTCPSTSSAFDAVFFGPDQDKFMSIKAKIPRVYPIPKTAKVIYRESKEWAGIVSGYLK